MTPERFLSHAKPMPNGCIEWQGYIHKSGYGMSGGKAAHRFAFQLFHGVDPTGFYVCHTCDNPKCVNPDHLWLGTPKDNNRDTVKKGRNFYQRKTHCKHGHEFTPENTYLWKGYYRQCKTCMRINDAKRRGK